MARFYKTFIIFLTYPLVVYPQYENIKFEQIAVNQGLSQSCINCIYEDSYGFMWFGSKTWSKKI